ncbi:hypothetical protein TNCV_1726011 [Trichonephila clavipes]|nr:hypothetical protein TNCV_1726011 [Trichonephila clavipes]
MWFTKCSEIEITVQTGFLSFRSQWWFGPRQILVGEDPCSFLSEKGPPRSFKETDLKVIRICCQYQREAAMQRDVHWQKTYPSPLVAGRIVTGSAIEA